MDAFNAGAMLTRGDCERKVHDLFQGKIEFTEEHLRPYTKREFLIRILNNLKNNYFNVEDLPPSYRCRRHDSYHRPFPQAQPERPGLVLLFSQAISDGNKEPRSLSSGRPGGAGCRQDQATNPCARVDLANPELIFPGSSSLLAPFTSSL